MLPPAERLTKERVRAFATHLAETNIPRSVAIQIDALYKAARIMLPDHDLAWLKSIKARLHSAAPVQQAGGPAITSLQILQVGLSLMDHNAPAEGSRLTLSRAVSYRDGLMIALLAFAPLRRKNLASLEIGRHLIGDGTNRYIVIPASETKTRTPIEFTVPALLLPYFDIYLTVVRPRLLKDLSCQALWISPRGSALRYGAIGDIVSRHTFDLLGVRLTPHDTRDTAATTWALADPSKIQTATDLLSHSDGRTMQRHYNRARGTDASRTYAQIIRTKRMARHRR
jgi:integrase